MKKTVYAIFNPFEWDKFAVKKFCAQDDDDIALTIHESYFEQDWYTKMSKADEIWLFGNCKFIPAAMIAKSTLMDVWQMG